MIFPKFSQFNQFFFLYLLQINDTVRLTASHVVLFVMFELQRTKHRGLLSSSGHTLSLEDGGTPAACWVQSLWMSACLTEGVTLYPTKYYVKA